MTPSEIFTAITSIGFILLGIVMLQLVGVL
jgi:hypothetical protein